MIDGRAYVAPLRFAVQWCVETSRGRRITVDAVATVAQVAKDRAAAYLSILVARAALVPDRDAFRVGPGWEAWASAPCRTRPKRGQSQAGEELDSMRRALCGNLVRRRVQRGLSQAELARRAGVHYEYIRRAERFSEPPPACALILISRALELPIEELVQRTASLG